MTGPPSVVITGAANGIGAALARRHALAGYAVAVLDLDASAADAVAKELVSDGLDFAQARVALLVFGSTIEVPVPLGTDREGLLAAIDAVEPAGENNMEEAFAALRDVLADRRPGALPLGVMISDGVLSDDPLAEAEWAHLEEIRVAAVCLRDRRACDPDFRRLASPTSYYLDTRGGEELIRFYTDLAATIDQPDVDRLSITHRPHPAFTFAGTPPGLAPPEIGPDGDLTWPRVEALFGRAELVYALEARGVGRWPVSTALTSVWLDSEGGVGVAALPVPSLEVVPPAPEGPCRITRATVGANPTSVEVGGTVAVRSDVALECDASPRPLEVALAVDHSFSMRGERLDNTIQAVEVFFDTLEPDDSRYAFVAFSDFVTDEIALTASRESILSAVRNLEPSGGTNIGLAMDRGRELLESARPGAGRVLILLTDGLNPPGAISIEEAASRLLESSVEFVAVCAGGSCDPALKEAVTRPGFYVDAPDPAALTEIYERIARSLQGLAPTESVVYSMEAPGMSPEPGGAPPPSGGPAPTWWAFGFPPSTGITVTQALRALEPGIRPASLWSRVDYATSDGQSGRLYLPPVEVEVTGPMPTTAPTALPLSPTATPLPSPTITPTPSPTPTMSPDDRRLWLPLLHAGAATGG